MANSALDYALNYISRYPKTEKELRVQLMQKGYVSLEIEKAMAYLKEKKYINDELFTEAYFRSECARKGKPTISVTQKLREKGVTKDTIQAISRSMEKEIQEGIYEKIKKDIEVYKKR